MDHDELYQKIFCFSYDKAYDFYQDHVYFFCSDYLQSIYDSLWTNMMAYEYAICYTETYMDKIDLKYYDEKKGMDEAYSHSCAEKRLLELSQINFGYPKTEIYRNYSYVQMPFK